MRVAEETAISTLSNIRGKLCWNIPVGVMGILMVMVLPEGTTILDLRTGLNTTLSGIIRLVSMYILQPVHFSVFPSLLLFFALFQLGLSVASARLVPFRGTENRIGFKDRS
jgi:flagellar biosynthesis protein FlhA